MTYPVPDNETERLLALRSLNIVGSAPAADFDAVVRTAAALFGCPFAMVSLMEDEFQWFKARCGLDLNRTDRDVAFCNQAIVTGEVFVVPDAGADPRFAGNALVTGSPHVRFYAGCPLSLDGIHVLGTLCIADTVPRPFSDSQIEQLRGLGRVVEGLLHAHRAAAAAIEAEERARAEAADASTRLKLLHQIERMASIGAWWIDLDTRETMWSDEIFALHDVPPGRTPPIEECLAFFSEADRAHIVASIERCRAVGGHFHFEVEMTSAKGVRRRVRSVGEVAGEPGGPRRLIGVLQDVSEQHEAEQRLWHLAHVDALSGIANRSWFQRQLGEDIEAARRDGHGLALMLLDLDGFKQINDTLGHQAGDDVIRVVAQRLGATLGTSAFCARLGGDEFAVLARMTDPHAHLGAFADEIVAQVRRPITLSGQQVFVSGSVGVARFPVDAETPDNLLKCADMALYKVKKSGRGTAGMFSPEIESIFDARRVAIEKVRRASLAGRIVPYYQPMVRLSDRAIYGYEALVRIRNRDGSLSGPADFWHAFSDAESARQIDDQMLAAVTRDISAWRAEGLDPGLVSLNASEYCFQYGDFAERLLDRLDHMQVPPGALKIEITETVFLGEDARLVEIALKKLHEAGVKIALDDFGTGYASLTHLRDFPIDRVKIDRSFVLGLGQKPQNTVIIKAIVDLAHNLQMSVVAEGVETEAQCEFLRSIGCDGGQGYLFSAALSAEATATDLRSRAGLPAAATTFPRPRVVA